ncbi:molybdate transport system ATP-binding protein [Conyzicola lurida]|uniref:Molybdate transport system ATP-binding protein n=1 Tax=Conyzicola lurida TaxID=1172621 RepID=A0A841AJI8_9MICO|nr:ABC transporter ATP-binding protein [Conyzicola lurida]MBB5844070.1 molybdate transport system ATP-binding protein [Conyzicola lurida]
MSFTLDARVDARDVDLAITVQRGETVAVLGPNGAGKSTLLGLAAGLLRADSGSATLDGATLFDAATFVPPHSRGVSLLAQDALLFPHLSVLENVAFGPRSAGVRAAAARSMARDWLGEVDALEFASRRPAELSGGQAQRIAVARALAAGPKLLLLDEPLAALDISVAPAVRRMLRRVLADRTALIVTHDILDAYTLADRVIVVDGGRVVEEGPTRSVLERPRTAFTAGLASLSVLTGERTATGLWTAGGDIAAPSDLPVGTAVAAAIRPAAVSVSLEEPREVNRLRGTVRDLEPRGDVIRVRSDLLSADVAPAVVADLDLALGTPVWFAFGAADVQVYAR